MTAPTEQESPFFELGLRASRHLAGMAAGALKAGQMPPRDVFDWFVDFTTLGLLETEKMVMAGNTDPDTGADLERYVVSLSELLRICDTNKLLVTKDRAMAALNARRLRLPPEFDHTYGGLLSG
jgi:hypothetical protein